MSELGMELLASWVDGASSLLVTWTILATIVVGIASMAERLLCHASAAIRHSVWWVLLASLLLYPVTLLVVPGAIPPNFGSLPGERSTLPATANEGSSLPSASSLTDIADSPYRPAHPLAHRSEPIASESVGPVLPSSEKGVSPDLRASNPASIRKAKPSSSLAWQGTCIGLFLWFFGGILFLIRIELAQRSMRLQWKRATPHLSDSLEAILRELCDHHGLVRGDGRHTLSSLLRVFSKRKGMAIRIAHDESGPLVFGWSVSRVLLPKSFERDSVESQRLTLQHEIAHILRGDEGVRLGMVLLRAIFWFHPILRFANHRISLLAEMACDDWVLRKGGDARIYARLLLELGRRSPASRSLIPASGMARSTLSDRIESILLFRPTGKRELLFGGRKAIVLSCFLAMGLGLLRPRSGESQGVLTEGAKAYLYQKSDVSSSPDVGIRDWPQWGGTSARNNVSRAQSIPVEWDASTGKNLRWTASLGSETYSTPSIANGRVFIGSNNGSAYLKRFPEQVDLGVLLCFEEASGKFLWQYSSPKLETGREQDFPLKGICSTPLIRGDRLWFVSNRCTVVCLDTNGFADGENDGPFEGESSTTQTDADAIWTYDMIRELEVDPQSMSNCSITLAGETLFVCTSQGRPGNRSSGEAIPSLIALDRRSGRLLWTDSTSTGNILRGQWSSPAFGIVQGEPQVVFGGGDGFVYGFSPEGKNGKAELLWKFDCNPKQSKYQPGQNSERCPIIATPVIYDEQIYVAVGDNPEIGEGKGRLWCIRPTHRGDVSPTLVYNRRTQSKYCLTSVRWLWMKGSGILRSPTSNRRSFGSTKGPIPISSMKPCIAPSPR